MEGVFVLDFFSGSDRDGSVGLVDEHSMTEGVTQLTTGGTLPEGQRGRQMGSCLYLTEMIE